MRILDLDKIREGRLGHDPCEYMVVPCFVRPEMLPAINHDYPDIDAPGNFPPETLRYGPTFAEMLEELRSEDLKSVIAEKFAMDLDAFPVQLTVRKYCEASNGNVHNDSKLKVITALIYCDQTWTAEGGRLRLVRNPENIEDFGAEIEPSGGTLLIFKRSERSYHGFKAYAGERRSLQMYYVRPKRAAPTENKRLSLKKRLKRALKVRQR